MKTNILCIFAFLLFMYGCTCKQRKEAVINSKNDTTQIDVITNYELEDCNLLYTEALPSNYQGTEISMNTEYKSYPSDIRYLSIYVYNPTNTVLDFGRDWIIEIWDGNKWESPKMKKDLIWFSDGFSIPKTHIVYCFRYPIAEYYILSKGKYRIIKTFHQDMKEVQLKAEFKIE